MNPIGCRASEDGTLPDRAAVVPRRGQISCANPNASWNVANGFGHRIQGKTRKNEGQNKWNSFDGNLCFQKERPGASDCIPSVYSVFCLVSTDCLVRLNQRF